MGALGRGAGGGVDGAALVGGATGRTLIGVAGRTGALAAGRGMAVGAAAGGLGGTPIGRCAPDGGVDVAVDGPLARGGNNTGLPAAGLGFGAPGTTPGGRDIGGMGAGLGAACAAAAGAAGVGLGCGGGA